MLKVKRLYISDIEHAGGALGEEGTKARRLERLTETGLS